MSDEARQLQAWYRVADMAPPAGVVVWVIWDGRVPFSAARVKHPTTGAPCWLTHDAGRPVLLPTKALPPNPSAPWAGWHTLEGNVPTYWRPKHPDKWQGPLPEAVSLAAFDTPGRMWSASQRRAKSIDMSSVQVSGMSAAEMAREMEDMRENARAGGDAEPEEDTPEPQWWLDPHRVTYSKPGSITMHEAEGRLMRAFNAEWWVRVEWPRLKTFSQTLANMSKPALSADAATDDVPRRFLRPEPTGRDQDDMLTALDWLRCLPRVTFEAIGTVHLGQAGIATVLQNKGAIGHPLLKGAEVLRLRGGTPALTWKRIGGEIGKSAEAARGIYLSALGEITAAANGGSTPEVDAVREKRAAERRRLDALGAKRKAQRAAKVGA